MSDFQQTITSLDLLHTSLYRMELFMNAQAVKNAKTDVISLISRLEKAERERDELRAIAEEHSKLAGSNAARAQKAEAELARRDATAGERAGIVEVWPGTRSCDFLLSRPLPVGQHNLYTAAPPAVLPELEQDVKNIIGLLSENEWAEHCAKSELGRKLEGEITRLHDLRAQQQKVVQLYKRKSTEVISGQRYSYVLLEDLLPELDAANVKWEVKK